MDGCRKGPVVGVPPRDVVVIGMGIRTALGAGVSVFTDALWSGTSGISHCAQDGLGVAARVGALDFVPSLAAMGLEAELVARARRAAGRAPRAAQVSLIATLEAWGTMGRAAREIEPRHVHLVVGGSNLELLHTYQMHEKFLAAPEYVPARYALTWMDTHLVGVVSEVLQLHGEGLTVGGASASGNVALIEGQRRVASGRCEVCVILGPMTDLSPVELRALQHTGALGGARDDVGAAEACRPFDQGRDGFIYGQGAACVILASRECAEALGVTVDGRILGGAMCLDGNHLSDPSVEGERRAMQLALEDAGIGADDVDYVNAHATSSVLGDVTELQALDEVFERGSRPVWVNGTKSFTGHCLSAAAVVEAVGVLVQLKHGFLHRNLNLTSPLDTRCQLVGPSTKEASCRLALSNAFGFGGINTSVVMGAAL
uniref:3-oxoacyl ACP synthase n=1 Tax=uncultured bacterium psy1 TaxID=693111 RepID=D2SUF0_9BACT|nr:3-oxoacyl ACP synthase [uncultured bacterium psy1]